MTGEEQQKGKRKFLLGQNLPLDQGTPSKGTRSDKREETKEEMMETDPSPNEKKE
jgi:hypothetical protein